MKLPSTLLFLLFSIPLLSQSISVRDLRCEHLANPMGIDAKSPRLSWRLAANGRNVMQTAYQIRVAEQTADLKAGRKLRWDSGRVNSEQSQLVPYGGPATAARQRLYWQVRVWDNQGKTSEWSEPAFWEMGLSPADWKAQWITAAWEEDKKSSQPSPYFRTTFTVKGKVARARAYLTSRGLYEAELNGKKVGDQLFTPGWTSYNKRLQYQVYDITDQIQPGANALGVVLGDGWYRGFIGWSTQRNFYGDQLGLLAQLEITYTNGKTETVLSGPGWKASTGPIRQSDIYNGEVYDAREELTGWSTPVYKDDAWKPVQVADWTKENLVASDGVPVRITEELKPVQLITTPKGEKVLDFGQNLTGRLRLRISGPAGTTLTLHHAEVLDKDGNFYITNLRAAKQELKYTLSGKGLEVYEPRFTFMGFRYVRVSGIPATAISPNMLTAEVIHSDMAPAGEFTCSDSLINRLQQNIRWGQRGNFLDVPTDCPQRDERMGWTGDAQAFSRTAAFNYDVAAFFTKWLQDVTADQLSDGRVPFVVPHVLGKDAAGSTGWADVANIIPWNMYLAYGDKGILEQQYSSMQAWVAFMEKAAGEDFLWNTGFHFGDWLFYSVNDDRDGTSAITDKYFIAQAFFAHSTDLLRRAAMVLGKTADAQKYARLLEQVKAAFLREYVTPGGRLVSSTQTAYVLALNFDLLPESMRPEAVDRLVDNVKRYGHLTTGFLGTPYLCHVLTRFGHTDLAYQLLERREYPSWLYPVTQGATTIWERWDGQRPDGSFQEASMNSFNHYAYGAIGDWLYRTVAGIDIDESKPGYQHILLRPTPGGSLTKARARHVSPFGDIVSGWQLENGRIRVEIGIPANTQATLRLPKAVLAQVREGGKSLSEAGITQARQDGGQVLVELGSGNYVFEYSY